MLSPNLGRSSPPRRPQIIHSPSTPGKALQAAVKQRSSHAYAVHWAGQGVMAIRSLPAAQLVSTLVDELNDESLSQQRRDQRRDCSCGLLGVHTSISLKPLLSGSVDRAGHRSGYHVRVCFTAVVVLTYAFR